MTLERQRKTSQYVKRILSPPSKEPQKLDLKVALVGPGGCGKSALATRILARRYITEYCPVLEGIYTRVLNVSGLEVSLSLWDTSEACGADYREEQVKVVVGAVRDPARFLDWADVVLLVYSITSEESLAEAKLAAERLTDFTKIYNRSVIVVGNKTDLEMYRKVVLASAASSFLPLGLRVIETSAADRQDSVDRLIFLIIKEHLSRRPCLLKNSEDLGPLFSSDLDPCTVPCSLLEGGISLQADAKKEIFRGRTDSLRARSNTESSVLASPAGGGRRRKDSLWTKMSFLPK